MEAEFTSEDERDLEMWKRRCLLAEKRLAQLGQHTCICMYDRIHVGRFVFVSTYPDAEWHEELITEYECGDCGSTGWCY